MKRLFNKKFKVRIRYFGLGSDYYVVEYAYYWLIPTYHRIMKYICFGPDTDLSEWNPVLETVIEAEEFAKKFKTIMDVEKYYEEQYNIKDQCTKERNAYLRKNVPYHTKNL